MDTINMFEWVQIADFIFGIAIGVIALLIVCLKYWRDDGVKVGGVTISLIGFALLSGSIWGSIEISADGIKVTRLEQDVANARALAAKREGSRAPQTQPSLGDSIPGLKGLGVLPSDLGAPEPAPSGSSSPPQKLAPQAAVPIPINPIFEEAKINIKWVLVLDSGARRRYEIALSDSKNKYQAVLFAQAHNSNAQMSIRAFGEARTIEYITELGF